MSRRRLWLAAATLPLAAVAVVGAEVQLARTGPKLPSTAPLDLDGTVGPGSLPPLRVTWLGDSTAAGVGASSPENALPRAVARLGRRPMTITSLAVSGARVADVLRDQVGRLPSDDPDVVFLSVGANDAVHLTGRRTFRHEYQALLEVLPKHSRVVVLGVPDMGAVVRFAQPLRALVGWRGGQIDHDVRARARRAGATYVDIAGATGPAFRRHPDRYFAADRFHPSDAGYRLWAQAVVEVME
ncbi:MAG TPA: SGNH/GDSL hydrolase family protein [Acidimicrobiales bacterium]|nr:SGNH/GDSL hydrolase family protein [Acidimicrobiales bacterium]